MSIFDDVKEVVVEQLNVPYDEFDEPKRKIKEYSPAKNVNDFLIKYCALEKDLILDDNDDVIKLVKLLEEKFDIQIPDDQAECISTVKDAIKFIENVKIL